MSRKLSKPLVSATTGRGLLAGAALVAMALGIPGAVSADDRGAAVQVAAMTEMAKPLTTKPGDPAAGKSVFINRKLGNCLACHALKSLSDQPFHGNIGPALDGVGSRYNTAELRLRIVNPKALNPDTIMPGFFKKDGLHRVMKKFQGKTILTAQQVEDVVSFLASLKEQ